MLPHREKHLVGLAILMLGVVVLVLTSKSLKLSVISSSPSNREVNSSKEAIKPVSDGTMHLAFVAFGKPGISDAYQLIQSIVFLSQGQFNFHIFSPDNSGEAIRKMVETWSQVYLDQVTVTSYPTKCPIWKKKSVNLPKAYINTGAKVCAYETMMTSNIREVTSKVIYMDLDIILLDDFQNLWDKFKQFNSTQLMGSIRADVRYLNQGFEFTYGKYGLNGGVLMMDLNKMVEVDFMTEYFKAFDRRYRKNYNRDDQDMLNVYFAHHPNRMLNLPCSFNVRHAMDSCGTSPHRCYEAEKEGVKLLHACVESVFTNSAYTPIYRCFGGVDFMDMPKSFKCLQFGVKYFFEKRLPNCPTHEGFMNSLKASLQKSVDVFNRRNGKNFKLNF